MIEVTKADYNEYGGIEIEDAQLARLLIRAMRDIDSLTSYQLEWVTATDIMKKAVKNAVCAQVEFLAIKGETASTIAEPEGVSFTIGSYSESSGLTSKQSSYSAITRQYAEAVKGYLWPTGLLYGGVFQAGS